MLSASNHTNLTTDESHFARIRAIHEKVLTRHKSITDWAKHQGFSPSLTYKVLKGERKALRGQSRLIANALLKELLAS